jgi:hypothetical protein
MIDLYYIVSLLNALKMLIIVAITFIYSECVYVALIIHHAKSINHIIIFGLPLSTILCHIIS